MDQLDVNLFDAWHRVTRELRKNPREAAKRRKGSLRPTLARPLRSWSLTLRADDKRIAAGAVVRYMRWPGTPDGPLCAVEAVTLTANDVRRFCRPIVIPWPGVSIDEAARRCGVNRATIHQWAKRGRVVMDYYACNPASARQANPNHRLAAKRVWTRRPIDPSGDVICGPWGQMRQALPDRISRFWQQTLLRSHRPTTPGAYIRFFACPRCRRWMKNVYWPMPVWTIAQAMGLQIQESRMASAALWSKGFICRHCAGLIYESVERRSRPSPGRHVDVWDRFVQRVSGGMLRGREVARPQSAM
ncbi:MAG: hypothetical protein IH983_01745 [Planctomycetes bacterium]|nr:hypothetical protein [Planctomycetota bacterium]